MTHRRTNWRRTLASVGLLAITAATAVALPPKHAKKPAHHAATRAHAPAHAASHPAAAAPAPAPLPQPDDPPRVTSIAVSDYDQVGWWRGDGNAQDDTHLNPGSLNGNVTFVPAMNGRGFRFTGRDDAVRVSDSFSLRLTRSFTINAWINIDAFPTPDEDKGMIIFRGDDRPGLDPYALWVGSDQHLTLHLDSETRTENLSAPITSRRFVMVTAILDDTTGKMELYENTVLVARTVTTVRPLADLDPNSHPGVGIGNSNAVPESGYRYPFHGVINDLRVFSRVLAPGEIRALYGEPLAVPSLIPQHNGG